MIIGAIDMGLEFIKAVVVKYGKVIGKATGRSGGANRAGNAEAVWKEALQAAGVAAADKIVATGIGKYDVPFADKVYTEPVCLMRAAKAADADATTVMNIGADETIVATMKADGRVEQMLINQKCSAGYGLMLEVLADRLGLSMEELSALDVSEAEGIKVSDGCMPFAELDALSLLNHGVCPRKIAAAALKSAAVRAAVVFDDITIHRNDRVLLSGGVPRIAAFVTELEKRTGVSFVIPEDPEYFTALGAALLAGGE